MTVLLLAFSMAGGLAAIRWPLPGLLAYLWFDFMRAQDYVVALRSGRPMLMIGIGLVIAALRVHRPQTVSEACRDFLGLGLLCLAVTPGIVMSENASLGVVLIPLKLALLSFRGLFILP